MNLLILLAFVAVFAIGFSAGSWFRQRRAQRRLQKTKANYEVSEIGDYHTILSELRDDRTPNAVEFMEFSTDCLVSRLRPKAETQDEAVRDRVFNALWSVKLYRKKWPRQARGDLLAAGGKMKDDVQAAAQNAQQILAGLERPQEAGPP